MLKSICLLYLPHRAEHMNYEHRDETKGPQSQARQAHENHNQLASPATTFVWLDALRSALGADDGRPLLLSRSAEKGRKRKLKALPQWLKPDGFGITLDGLKAVPFTADFHPWRAVAGEKVFFHHLGWGTGP